MAGESFDLGFDSSTTYGSDAGVHEISVHFDEKDDNSLAWVTSTVVDGGKSNMLELHINMKFYDSIDESNENGVASGTSMYLDRTLAHEFTHAVMAANIADFHSLPKWFKEGSAELSHGADDARAVSMVELLQNPSTLQDVLNEQNSAQDEGDYAYAAGYMILRYMAKEGAAHNSNTNDTQLKVIRSLMGELAQNGGTASAFDAAISTATNGKFTSQSDLITQFMNVVNNYSGGADIDQATAFLKTNFTIDTPYYSNIDDPDTGSITGSDAGGSTDKNKEDVVPESTQPSSWSMPSDSTTTYSGLKVNWGDGYTTIITNGGSSVSTNGDFQMTEKKLHFHVGANANESINVGFWDMRADKMRGQMFNTADTDRLNALSYDTDAQAAYSDTLDAANYMTLSEISVNTRENANIAIRVLDGVADFVLNQLTDIGAVTARLEYTVENLTTSSENLQSAESTIRDADMAKEMTNYTKANVLMQAAQSMLAQANQSSSAILSLLQ